ncbi:zf-HC2 domain-containing protein [Cellulomonas sp. KRMCY2]|uniref:zf-HC2 domain-containing protein n=1 Tax=Cellulomonas sp. KRMCY2 TaxID=1304865 RepID=UPI00045EBA83|nr:zf-HC2 domain-containing protein [Cellulomonas sp. KRMCY2]
MRLSRPDRSGRDDDARREEPGEPGAEHRTAVDAGPYVLGALSVPERLAFEAHLATCAECRRAVDDVAALPALLDLVPADVVRSLPAAAGPAADAAVDPVDDDLILGVAPVTSLTPDLSRDPGPPPMLLADLLRVARREESTRLRRRWLGGSLAAAAVTAIALVVSGGPAGLPWRSPVPAPTIAAEAIELAPLLDVPVRASVQLDAVAWGTRIDLRCSYDASEVAPGGPYGGDPAGAAEYSLVVRDAEGKVEEVATWTAVPGHEVTVPAATGMPLDEIVEVELRSGGTPVLRAET